MSKNLCPEDYEPGTLAELNFWMNEALEVIRNG